MGFSYPCLTHCTSSNRLNLLFLVRTWLTAHSSNIISTTSIWCTDSWEVALIKSWLGPNTIKIIDDDPGTRVLSKMQIKKGSGSCGKIEYDTSIIWRSIHWDIANLGEEKGKQQKGQLLHFTTLLLMINDVLITSFSLSTCMDFQW